ncbi:MAG: hypothetical protein U1E05_06145, partial [Patescibacteria group bacterium]|nr:hypothetical protein [Patescibacteria group bacterium]
LECPGGTVLARGIALGQEQMATADLLVLVFDRTAPLSEEEQSWMADWPNALCVDNKCDLPQSPARRRPARSASALTGEGLDALLRAIAHRLVPDAPAPGTAVPFTEEQCLRLQAMADRCSGD